MTEITKPLQGKQIDKLSIGGGDIWLDCSDGSTIHFEIEPGSSVNIHFNKSKQEPISNGTMLWSSGKNVVTQND